MNAIRTGLGTLTACFVLLLSISALALPNLTPYQPSGWSDKIVISTNTGTSTDSGSFSTADTLYVDWAVINSGTAAGAFSTSLSIDGVPKTSFNSGSLG